MTDQEKRFGVIEGDGISSSYLRPDRIALVNKAKSLMGDYRSSVRLALFVTDHPMRPKTQEEWSMAAERVAPLKQELLTHLASLTEQEIEIAKDEYNDFLLDEGTFDDMTEWSLDGVREERLKMMPLVAGAINHLRDAYSRAHPGWEDACLSDVIKWAKLNTGLPV